MLRRGRDYRETYEGFRWNIPADLNIAWDVCGRHAQATPGRTALIHVEADGALRAYSFAEMERLASRAANMLAAHGIGRGDRVVLHLSQSPELAMLYLGLWKLAAVPLPVSILFGEEALAYRLRNSGAKAIATDHAHLESAHAAAMAQAAPPTHFLTDGPGPGAVDAIAEMARAKDARPHAATTPDTPGLLAYTSGTTGQPKGALHGHRVGLGHTTGYSFVTDFPPHANARVWSPADWTWIGGVGAVLLPTWHHGMTMVSTASGKFDPEWAFRLLQDQHIDVSLVPPTALKMMRAVPDPQDRFDYRLRALYSGGESLGAETLEWGRNAFGLDIAECYGQTECNLFIGTCPSLMKVKPGAIGLPTPGHVVEVIDRDGGVCPPGQTGDIAVRRGDPCMMLEYWRNPEATRDKFRGDWMLTGDLGQKDADGYITFFGRDDDVITSAGYRIGPGEIEDCIMSHAQVKLAAAIGVPDPIRTEVVKAFVVLKDGLSPTPALEDEIRAHVRGRLAAHEYPRLIEFRDDLPLTVTGKIRRRDLRDAEIEKQKTAQGA
ncbi:MAG: AMP-binding protein [Alphaproteobacteria bacterium]